MIVLHQFFTRAGGRVASEPGKWPGQKRSDSLAERVAMPGVLNTSRPTVFFMQRRRGVIIRICRRARSRGAPGGASGRADDLENANARIVPDNR
jgi:hypothetical protein